MADRIIVEQAPPLATLTLNRAAKLNPLDWKTVQALLRAVDRLEAERDVSVVILTGAGRAFSAGGDLEGYLSLYRSPLDFRRFLNDFAELHEAIERSAKIYVAAVNGPAVAGGLELMLACDLVLAAEEATIADGHVNFGQLPGAGGSQRLPRVVGRLRANWLILTGETIDAREAERIGLVNRVVPGAELMAEAKALGLKLAAKSRAGLSGAKKLVNRGLALPRAEALEMERRFVHAYATTEPDATEGLLAFKEKRPPRFRKE
jgi:enoyl-CoA hydratase